MNPKLFAISDLHLDYKKNLGLLEDLYGYSVTQQTKKWLTDLQIDYYIYHHSYLISHQHFKQAECFEVSLAYLKQQSQGANVQSCLSQIFQGSPN